VISGRWRRAQVVSALTPYIERARRFTGWSFKDVAVEHLDERMPWSYEQIVRDYAPGRGSIIDLGTGGGEVFGTLLPSFDIGARLYASEEWHVNAPVAHRALAPLGVRVLNASSERMPYRDSSFDLILSRHEAIDPPEIARTLAPGGVFITQQVGHDSWRELDQFFPNAMDFPDHFVLYREGLSERGLTIERAERHEERVRFATLGDLVFLLLVAPWTVPGLDPVRDIDTLMALEDALSDGEGIVLTETHYILVASRPA
jgi:SAM-dependent methyltransferase